MFKHQTAFAALALAAVLAAPAVAAGPGAPAPIDTPVEAPIDAPINVPVDIPVDVPGGPTETAGPHATFAVPPVIPQGPVSIASEAELRAFITGSWASRQDLPNGFIEGQYQYTADGRFVGFERLSVGAAPVDMTSAGTWSARPLGGDAFELSWRFDRAPFPGAPAQASMVLRVIDADTLIDPASNTLAWRVTAASAEPW